MNRFLKFALGIVVFANGQQAYQDYTYQFNLYRQSYSEFVIAKTEYEKFKSLTSETLALEKTRGLLSQRVQLLRSYLLLVSEKFNATPGLIANDRELYQTIVTNEIAFLENHAQLIPETSSLADAAEVSDGFVSHYNLFSANIRQTLIAISLGQLATLASQYDATVAMARTAVETNRQLYLPQKAATFDRWLLAIVSKKSLYQQKVDNIKKSAAGLKGEVAQLDKNLNKIQLELMEAKQYLNEGTSFLRELTVAMRYLD